MGKNWKQGLGKVREGVARVQGEISSYLQDDKDEDNKALWLDLSNSTGMPENETKSYNKSIQQKLKKLKKINKQTNKQSQKGINNK